MKQRYTIAAAMESVAECLKAGTDHGATTIRCSINDALEAAERDGYAVNHGYDQARAVAKVKRMLNTSRAIGGVL